MSDPFQVFSAKKFPGMIESTALSKKFAAQGIRIPVRHSGDKNDNDADYPDDDWTMVLNELELVWILSTYFGIWDAGVISF